jgi:hypothetical protein
VLCAFFRAPLQSRRGGHEPPFSYTVSDGAGNYAMACRAVPQLEDTNERSSRPSASSCATKTPRDGGCFHYHILVEPDDAASWRFDVALRQEKTSMSPYRARAAGWPACLSISAVACSARTRMSPTTPPRTRRRHGERPRRQILRDRQLVVSHHGNEPAAKGNADPTGTTTTGTLRVWPKRTSAGRQTGLRRTSAPDLQRIALRPAPATTA